MAEATQRAAGPSLGDVNVRMEKLGPSLITPQIQQEMVSKAPRDRIIRAIFRAADENDVGARTWIENLLIALGVIDGGRSVNQQAAANDSQALGNPASQRQQQPRQGPSQQQQRPPANTRGHTEQRRQPEGSDARQGSQDRSDPRNERQDGASGRRRQQHEERVSVHVYGGKAALCFENDMSRGEKPTVSLDGAMSIAERTYDWNNKIRLQMTQAEMPVVAAVLLGIVPKCEFSSHGPEKNKGFSMERQQAGKVFVRVFCKGEPMRAVPMEAPDVFRIAGLFVRQLRKQQPWLDGAGIIAVLRATLGQYGSR